MAQYTGEGFTDSSSQFSEQQDFTLEQQRQKATKAELLNRAVSGRLVDPFEFARAYNMDPFDVIHGAYGSYE